MNARSITPAKKDISQIKAIIDAVSSVWGIDTEIILGRSRRQPGSFARQLCMALAYKKTHLSLNQVGECFDNRDHGTVLHAIKKVDEASDNKEIKPLIQEVISKLKPA
jgi:chromosomal replication initiator protein